MAKTGAVGNGQNTFGYKLGLGCSFLTYLVPVRFHFHRNSIVSITKSGCTHLSFVFQSFFEGKPQMICILVFLGRRALRPTLAMTRRELESFRVNGNSVTFYDSADTTVQGLSQSRESKHYERKHVFNEFLLGDRDRECRNLFRPDTQIQASFLSSRFWISFLPDIFLKQGYCNLKGDGNFANPLFVHLVNFDGFYDYDVALTCAKG
jgi:hypothetical protein